MITKVIVIIIERAATGGGLVTLLLFAFMGYVAWERHKKEKVVEDALIEWNTLAPEKRRSVIPIRSLDVDRNIFIVRPKAEIGRGPEAVPIIGRITDVGMIANDKSASLYYLSLSGPGKILLRATAETPLHPVNSLQHIRLPCLTVRHQAVPDGTSGTDTESLYCFSNKSDRLLFWRSFMIGYGFWQSQYMELARLRQQDPAITLEPAGPEDRDFSARF